jgi:hypothetical protein
LEYANYEFQVTGDDIEGLTVITTPAARIVGRITFDGAPTAPGVSPSAFTLTTQSDAAMRVAPGRVSISKDWTFEIRDVLGTGFLVLDDRTQTWLVDSISEGDRDITDQRMDFKALDGKVLELRLTRQRTDVLGSAAASNGPAIKDFVAVMFSEDPSRWYRHSRYLKTATPDQFGHFRITGLPPGSYLLVAVTGMEKGDEYNAEYLERLRPTAVRLTLAKGESKQVAVTVSPMPK